MYAQLFFNTLVSQCEDIQYVKIFQSWYLQKIYKVKKNTSQSESESTSSSKCTWEQWQIARNVCCQKTVKYCWQTEPQTFCHKYINWK